MSQITKSKCNMCGNEISWHKEAMAELGSKKPLNPDKRSVHECPKDGNGKIIVKVGEEEFVRQKRIAYIAKKENITFEQARAQLEGGPNLSAGQEDYPNQSQAQAASTTAAILNSKTVDISIKTALAELLYKFDQVIKSNQEKMEAMDAHIDMMSEEIHRLKAVVEEFVNYNPAQRAMVSFMKEIMPYVNIDEFKSQSALKTLEQEEREQQQKQQQENIPAGTLSE